MDALNSLHTSVLIKEVNHYLSIKRQGTYVDATGGAGGHAGEILKRLAPDGGLLIADRDPFAVAHLRRKFRDDCRCKVIEARFSEIFNILAGQRLLPVDGVLADLGLSSDQLGDPARGFSFRIDGPLDMRMDPRGDVTAEDILRGWNEKDLESLIFRLGEERYARRLARAIIFERRHNLLDSTQRLGKLCERVLGPLYRKQAIHPATRLFQALRMEVNQEQGELIALLESLPKLLNRGGRALVISFHSLEDRLVKQAFQKLKKDGWSLITKKPLRPGADEMSANPRCRSAKLRVIENRA